MPWQTTDPFLFCVHHKDDYPAGNDAMGPAASLEGREIGMDFAGKDGWSMYHGDLVPGFPRHPHRGFETITIARSGFIDHSDSLGATARFGEGDVQWMTAGQGIVHSEMFPLVQRDRPNPAELFQIWLNLPREDKMVEPHFTMLWSETIPTGAFADSEGRTTEVTVVAGALGDLVAPAPAPNSWAARPDSDVAIYTIRMQPNARWTLPATSVGSKRTLYFFAGDRAVVAGAQVREKAGLLLEPAADVVIEAGSEPTELLMLQGRPIGEPVVAHGPFVMNTAGEIRQAMIDFQRTSFGGWPWPSDAPVHPRDETRFAVHADGKKERPHPVG